MKDDASRLERQRPRRRAFTLVELLVTVAVIAVLVSLLLPALSKGKAAARRIVCLNHFGQLTKAQLLYAHDNGDDIARESFLPNGVTVNLWAQVQHVKAVDVWYNALPELLGHSPALDFAPSVIRPAFYSRRLIFHCPDAKFPRRAGEDATAYFSIAMNSKLIMAPLSTMKTATIERPDATVAFVENRLPDEPSVDPDQTPFDLGQPSAYANRFVVRHNRRGHLSFMDGHVEPKTGSEVVSRGLAIDPQTNIIWTADPAVNPNW
jgi:prepilin-type N-terminal cleavage/methylation domain-containing protein/prepilin-type processing-associated H-X9-DG protein